MNRSLHWTRTSREALLRDFHRTVKGLGVTVVLVTHDRHEAFALAQRVAVLDRGRIGAVRQPRGDFPSSRQAIWSPALSALKIVSPASLKPRTVRYRELRVGGQSVAISGNYAVGAKVILCFRASNVQVAAGVPSQARPIRFEGKIREVFCAQADSQIVVDCTGFSLVGSAESARCQSAALSEGCAVTASLEPTAIHVILAENSL